MTTRVLPGMRLTASLLDEMLNPPVFHGRQTAVQSVGNAAFAVVNLHTADIDTHTGWSAATPNRYTCKLAGMYDLSGSVAFDQNSNGGRGMVIRVNGSTYVRGSGVFVGASALTVVVVASAPRPWFLNVGDYVELLAYQASGGGPLNTFLAVDQASGLSVRRIRGSA